MRASAPAASRMLQSVQRDEELNAWMVLARAPRLERRAGCAGDVAPEPTRAAALLQASSQDWQRAGLSPSTRDYLRRAAPSTDERRWLENPRHELLPFTDARYPHRLRSATGTPWCFTCSATATLLNRPQLAIVGSRTPSAGGRDTAFQFARNLASEGLTITSGLAIGIDGAAHRGALAAGGSTIAALGTGVNLIYPRAHYDLSAQMVGAGALVSEFSLGTPPQPKNFPRRNATIAGMSGRYWWSKPRPAAVPC